MKLARWLTIITVLAGATPAQAQPCPSPVATVTAAGGTYTRVNVAPFEGRLYLYAPAIASAGTGPRPFELWVVEGVYGRPFVRESGNLSAADFAKLRANRNVRATAIRVVRGDGSESTRLRLGKTTYRIVVRAVSTSGTGSVNVQVCAT